MKGIIYSEIWRENKFLLLGKKKGCGENTESFCTFKKEKK